MSLRVWIVLLIFLVVIPSFVSAGYLDPLVKFVKCQLIHMFTGIGNSLAVIMFIYGAAKYLYASNDPGGRKQAMGVCIASIVALMIIQMAELAFQGLKATAFGPLTAPADPTC